MPQLYDSVTMVTESSEMPQDIGHTIVQSQQVHRIWQTRVMFRFAKCRHATQNAVK